MPIRTNTPITSDILNKAARELATSPHIYHTTIGTSRRGCPIHAFIAGRGDVDILINAAHHANEWLTALVLTRFLEELAAQPETAPWAKKVRLHCIPMVNPDGVDMVVAGQKNGGTHDNWKANICGVDLNSNYPAGWEDARERKFSQGYNAPGPRDYVGPQPLSEPESCAMAAYTTVNDIDVTISLHSQGEEIYWQYPGFSPEGAEKLAHAMAKASGYALMDVPAESCHAGYRDWFIENFNRPGFTIECGYGENPLPLSQFDKIYKEVSALLWAAIDCFSL